LALLQIKEKGPIEKRTAGAETRLLQVTRRNKKEWVWKRPLFPIEEEFWFDKLGEFFAKRSPARSKLGRERFFRRPLLVQMSPSRNLTVSGKEHHRYEERNSPAQNDDKFIRKQFGLRLFIRAQFSFDRPRCRLMVCPPAGSSCGL
jgi:hypothetical protein